MAGEYFEMLGVRPILGRGFIEEEKRPERDAHVAVLSYPFWKQRFGGSRQGTTKESVQWRSALSRLNLIASEGRRSACGS